MEKAKIRSHDDLASAIDTAYKRLKGRVESVDLDAEIKVGSPLSEDRASRDSAHVSDRHLVFLTTCSFWYASLSVCCWLSMTLSPQATLSLPPEQSTHELAESYLQRVYNPPKLPGPLTWKEILADEPFHGQHWEGVYGLPPGSTVEGWEVESGGSSPSLSPWDDDMDDINRDDGSDSLSLAGSVTSMQLEENDSPLRIEGGRDDDDDVLEDVPEFYKHRKAFEELQARQYWKPEWRIQADLDRPFNIRDHSTLAPSLDRVQKGSSLGIFGAAAHEVQRFRSLLGIVLTIVTEIHS